VEVSSNGVNYYRFPATSLTDTNVQVDAFGSLDATKINNLAGKYRATYGTPFDLEELSAILALDINHITHVRITDVVGSVNKLYASYDFYGHAINDPWPTPFTSSGIDVDAIGVIHQDMSSVMENQVGISVNLFPNPCTDQFSVSSEENLQLALIDINGRILKEFATETGVTSINMELFTSGLYFLRASSTNGTVFLKIIKT
jgi:hypothetical protein